MNLVGNAILAPGVCGICGNSQGAMVDTGAEVRLSSVMGRLYICRQFCVPKVCETAGALNPAAAKALLEQVAQLEAENDRLRAKVNTMAPVIRAVAKARELDGNEIGTAEVA